MSKSDCIWIGVGVFLLLYAKLPYDWVSPRAALLGVGLVVPPFFNHLFEEAE